MAKVETFLRMPFHNKLNLLHQIWRRYIGVVYYRRIFGSFGAGSVLYKPMLLSNTQYMDIGKNVLIREGARIELVIIDPDNPPSLHIEDNVNIEQNVHIVVLGKMRVKKDSTIASHCSFLCGNHPFFDVTNPIKIGDRLTGANSFIEIGPRSLIGVGTVVQMNVCIGEYVVVGSNSVVKKSIPDFSVADGNPARVILQYEKESDRWIPRKQHSLEQ